ncbi:MAG: hypothetical protein K5829_04790, partial [Treponema sp.]|nr:hypothetical protein [Treponema sp.]
MSSLFNSKKNILFFLSIFITLLMISSCEHELSTVDTVPTDPVSNVNTTIGDKSIYLSWINPTDNDFYGTRITFTPSVYGVSQPVVIEGNYAEYSNTIFNGLSNGTEYT